MIDLSGLYCGDVREADLVEAPGGKTVEDPRHLRFSGKDRPVVVWNSTRTCNLACVHCYTDSTNVCYKGELTTEEGKALIDDLAGYGVPVLLFSGGEPLVRGDIFTLASHAASRGLRPALSTNGTMIDSSVAEKIKEAGFRYVGISLDGIGEIHDRLRGWRNAYAKTLNGIRSCVAAGLKVGLRFTINLHNFHQALEVLETTAAEGAQRVCFYHLVHTGRAARGGVTDIDHSTRRMLVAEILAKTEELYNRGKRLEVLTVGNHADGLFLYQTLRERDPQRAAEVLRLLRRSGGNGTGIRIACVDEQGVVHPDQFWRSRSLGNIRERLFSEIWEDESNPFLWSLRNRKTLLDGRCARCIYLDVCNGNMRSRAEAICGDPWASDPACYLTDKEISAVEPLAK